MSLPGFFRVRTLLAIFGIFVAGILMTFLYKKAGDIGSAASPTVSESSPDAGGPIITEGSLVPAPTQIPTSFVPVPTTITVVPGSAVQP